METKKIDSLTKEQVSKLEIYKNKFLDKFFNPKKEASFKEVKEYVYWLYKFCNLEKPITILVNSPYECVIAYQYCKMLFPILYKNITQINSQMENQVWDQVGDQVRNQVWNQVGNQVRNQVWNQVGDQVRNQVRNQVWNQVGDQVSDQVMNQVMNQVGNQVSDQVMNQVRNQVGNQVWNQVGDQVWNQVNNQVRNQVEKEVKVSYIDPSYSLSAFNSWISFYDFFDKELNIYKESTKKIFNEYSKILDLNIFWGLTFSTLCIVSKNATTIHRNANFQLHSSKGPAIIFPKGESGYSYKMYFINGRSIPREIAEISLNNELTKEVFINEKNDEYKSAWYAYSGEEKMLKILEAIEIDRFTVTHNNEEEETITLFKTKENLNKVENKPYAWLKRICPSTGTVYLTSTNPDFDKAEAAARFHRPDFVPTTVGYRWYSRS